MSVTPLSSSVPRHVAIIMDGNGRWAKGRGLPRTAGHKQGIEAVKRTLEAARKHHVPYLTLFVFSSENWRRAPSEISDLMGLLGYYLKAETAKLHKEGVCLRVIGDKATLSPDIASLLANTEDLTRNNSNLVLNVAISYGSRQEIQSAVRQLAEQVKEGALLPNDISEDIISQTLWTKDSPDPDLIIRTGGEQRLSNFLLWQAAYAELVFMPVYWPDFAENHFAEALNEFAKRERRYGHAIETVA